MAPRLKRHSEMLESHGELQEPQSAAKHGRRLVLESIIAIIVGSIFLLKIFAYVDPSALSPSSVTHTVSLAYRNTVGFVDNLPILNSCPT